MRVVLVLLGLAVTAVMSQEILEVSCGQDAIVARFNKQTVDSANYQMEDLHFNDPECLFDGEEDGYYIKRVEPLSSCGTDVAVNATHAVFSNSIASGQIETGLSFPHGIIVGQPENENLISVNYQCTYEIDLRLSAAFIPNITYVPIPIPDAIGEGFFQVAMAIYKDATYREFYNPDEEGIPTLQPEDTVYVGITMVDDTSSDLYIQMRRCWATPGEVPTSEPFYNLIVDQCPVVDAVEGSVTVTQNGIGHQALWQSKVFKFVGEGDEFQTVWLHCDLTICVGDPCPAECDARRRRRSAFYDDEYTVSYGPIIRSKHTEIHFGPEGKATIIVQNDTDAYPEKYRDPVPPTNVSDHTLIIAIGAFAAFCMLCLSVALVIVLMRLKRAGERRPSGEVTPTGTINKGFSI